MQTHRLYIHLHFHLHGATLICLTAWIFACAKFCLPSMFKSLSDIVNAYHANYRTLKNTCDSSQTEKPPSAGLFTLIPRRLGVIFHAFSVHVALADKAGSFMVDLKEMRVTNLLLPHRGNVLICGEWWIPEKREFWQDRTMACQG